MEQKLEQSLIQQAQQGDQDALGRLAQAAKPRVCAYLYRVALNYDLAEDLTQETLMEMVKSIDNLREPEHFWGWLYRIASNKFLNHCRQKRIQKTTEQVLIDNFTDRVKVLQKEHGLGQILNTELSQAVLTAIGHLEPQDRSVLSLRCYDQLAYTDIAGVLNTSEMNARVIFYRAKQALKKELVRQGLSKTVLLMALGFFGSLTQQADADSVIVANASVSIPAEVVDVPIATTILAVCGLKGLFIAAGILLVSSALIISTGISNRTAQKEPVLPGRQDVRSYHFTSQSRNAAPGAPGSLSKGAYEQWYYHPQDVDGPVFMRMLRWSPDMKERLCVWLQNAEGNYYYESGTNTIYKRNYRLWGRTLDRILVKRLPTDEPQFCDFLTQMEGNTRGLVEHRDPRTELLAAAIDNRFVNTPYFKTTYEYNGLQEALFNYNWPAGISVVDERDPMRKRGWTCFQIEGAIDNEPLTGYGQIPFFYAASKEHPAWLVLNAGKIKIVDTKDAAMVLDADGKEIARYAGYRFFKGLLRPWMGMHTVDVIRRDAAGQEIPFETIQLSDYSKSGSDDAYYADAKVICNDQTDSQAVTMTWLVAMKDDVLKSLEVKISNAQGRTHDTKLEFTYLQDISKLPQEIQEPQITPATSSIQPDNGIRWLADLANHTLGAQ